MENLRHLYTLETLGNYDHFLKQDELLVLSGILRALQQSF